METATNATLEPTVSLDKPRLKWGIISGIVLLHVGALFAPFTFTWPAFWLFLVMYFITGLLGITLCYHRLLTHRSFTVPKWLEYALTLCASLALQGGTLKWVSTHRVHHIFSDRPGDPHSPRKGFLWAHMGWLFIYDDLIDDPKNYNRFVKDLIRDPVHRWIDKTQVLQSVILGLAFLAWGGWSFVVWGLFFRAVFVYHVTWLVNSAAHVWGYQTFNTDEDSRNNWWVALLAYGEGWHNNHHAFAQSAAHGLRWWEIDITYLTIRALQALGLARRLQLPTGKPNKIPSAETLASRGIQVPLPRLSSV